jgi:hypothetical protein
MASEASNSYSLPNALPHNSSANPSAAPNTSTQSWRNRLSSMVSNATNSTTNNNNMEENHGLHTANTNASTRTRHVPKWYKVRLFKGMIDDVKRRAPYYWSDYKDAWDYRVVPATIYMYFAKYVEPLALLRHVGELGLGQMEHNGRSTNMMAVSYLRWLSHWICECSWIVLIGRNTDSYRFTKTNMSYGVNEVLLASVLGSVVFAVFAAQPLVIVGVTGPITVFN